jgi:hypothetical protein
VLGLKLRAPHMLVKHKELHPEVAYYYDLKGDHAELKMYIRNP